MYGVKADGGAGRDLIDFNDIVVTSRPATRKPRASSSIWVLARAMCAEGRTWTSPRRISRTQEVPSGRSPDRNRREEPSYWHGRPGCTQGRGGRDTTDGAEGNDRLFGGAGNDRLYGGSGRIPCAAVRVSTPCTADRHLRGTRLLPTPRDGTRRRTGCDRGPRHDRPNRDSSISAAGNWLAPLRSRPSTSLQAPPTRFSASRH